MLVKGSWNCNNPDFKKWSSMRFQHSLRCQLKFYGGLHTSYEGRDIYWHPTVLWVWSFVPSLDTCFWPTHLHIRNKWSNMDRVVSTTDKIFDSNIYLVILSGKYIPRTFRGNIPWGRSDVWSAITCHMWSVDINAGMNTIWIPSSYLLELDT